MFISDHETEVDLLYYEPIAGTIGNLLRESRGSPITIGVHGDWGAGKSSILKMVELSLKEDKKTLCIWFNGWVFEGFEDAKTVVIENIVEELKRARPNIVKVQELGRQVLRRVDWLKVAKKAGGIVGGLLFTLKTGLPAPTFIKPVIDGITALISKPRNQITSDDLGGIATIFTDVLKPEENVPQQMHAFRKDFEDLVAAAEIDQLVVLIDDLDRCLPQTAIATLEAIRLFLFVPRTAFVIAADEAMIEYSVRHHFPDMPASAGPASYARNYLEKLIQVPFRVPALGQAEMRNYILLLLAQCALGSEDAAFQQMIQTARNDMRRPWESRGFNNQSLTSTFARGVPPEITQALQISNQITKLMTEGTRGNPRQVKRFLNALMMRQDIAKQRGFEREIHRPVLAKIMLAERFSQEFYEEIVQLVNTSSNGQVAELDELEQKAQGQRRNPASDVSKTTSKKSPSTTASKADEWLKSGWIAEWALIEPSLKNIDLRPYIFVSRDKRGYIGGPAVTAHLEDLVERLMGPTLSIQGVEARVRALTGTEPEQVFNAIREAILEAEDFQRRPRGVEGMAFLFKHHTALQRRLVPFLEEIDESKLGTWAATFWDAYITDPEARSNLRRLVQGWSQGSQNTALKGAAELFLQMSKSKGS